jgi:hypothetical protein
MNLKYLTDSQLLIDTESLVRTERELSTKILYHLKEIDVRKLYSDLKCSSLHDYCVRVLRMSEGDAFRKIQSARLLVNMPEIEQKLEEGKLTLTNLASAASFFKQQDIIKPEERKEVLSQIENLSKEECDKKLFEISGTELPAKETQKRISDNKTKVTMILSDETLEKIKKLKAMITGSLTQEELLGLALDLAIEKKEKEKFKTTDHPKTPSPVEVAKRYVSASLKRAVYERDKKCTNCGSTRHLNFDHVRPFSLGGKSTLDNLRLLCFQCNQRGRIRVKLVIS